MEIVIKEHLGFIRKLIDIGRKQQSLIERRERSPLYVPKEYVQVFGTILHTEKLYVENFWNFTLFLEEKIETEKDDFLSYYFALTRTLTEIYAELVYLLKQDDNKKFGICVAQYLFQLSQRYRYPNRRQKNNALKDLYESYYRTYSADRLGLPESIEGLSINYLRKSGFDFPHIEEIIRNYLNLQDSAPITKKLFPTLTNELIYDLLYRVQSDFLHGSIYLLLKTKGKPQNKRYQIITLVEILGFLFLELVDDEILHRETEDSLELLSKEFERIRGGLVDSW